MDQGFIDILQTLIKEQGKDAILEASKCKALLSDYTKGEYKKESRFLMQALEAKVSKAVDTTKEIDICRKQQVRLLHEDYGLTENIAEDLFDTLLFILKGVPVKKRDTSVKKQEEKNSGGKSASQAEPEIKDMFYYSVNGEDKGPVEYKEILKKINEKVIKRDTLVWKTGMKDWTEAASVKEISGLFPPESPKAKPPRKSETPPPKPVISAPEKMAQELPTKTYESNINSLLKDGVWEFFKNKNDREKLYGRRRKDKYELKINDDKCSFVNTIGEWVYYLNESEQSRIYKIRTDGTGRQKLCDDKARHYEITDGCVYYINGDDNSKIYKILVDGTGRRKINDDRSWHMNISGGWVYYKNESDSNKLYKIRADGTGRQKIYDDIGYNGFKVAGDWILFINENDGNKIYRIRTDGTSRQKICDYNCSFLTIINDLVYFATKGENKHYKMRIDGTELQLEF